jgi:thiamine-phosphate pyrophosphorylase
MRALGSKGRISVFQPLRGLYAITPDGVDREGLRAMVFAYAAGGGVWLQYRNKSADPATRASGAASAAEFCKLCDVRLIINDDIDLALEVGADGVHLGGDDGDLRTARRRIGPGRILGASCYDQVALAVAARENGADYVALGALYPSPTKPGAVRASLDLIGRAQREAGLPVVAIGGIKLDNAAPVIAAGADMVAVITDLFGAPDVAARTASFQKLFE